MNIVAILILGAVGGIARFTLEGFGFFGTIAVNLVGSFLLGAVGEMLIHKRTAPWIRDGVIVGLLGCFTTFSSFAQEAEKLIASGLLAASLFTLAGVVGGMTLYWFGEQTVKWVINSSPLQRSYNEKRTTKENYMLSPLTWSGAPAEPNRHSQE